MSDEARKRLLEIGKLKPIASPEVPAGRAISLPDNDDNEEDARENIANDIGAAYFVTYRKSDKSVSKRRISIKKISKSSSGAIMLFCYCHERKAMRSFRADRIEEAVDLSTGEIISDFLSTLNTLSGAPVFGTKKPPSPTATILAAHNHALNVLVFLGRCDKRLDHSEVDVICHFIMNKNFEADLNDKEIVEHINRLYPDYDTFISSVEGLHGKGELRTILRYACQMIQADNIITEDEHRFVEEMQQYL